MFYFGVFICNIDNDDTGFCCLNNPTGVWRNDNVIMTSKWCRDVVLTIQLCRMSAEKYHHCTCSWHTNGIHDFPEIAILINMWEWRFLFRFLSKIPTNNLANTTPHRVNPQTPFNLWSPTLCPSINYGYINASLILCDQNGWIWRLCFKKYDWCIKLFFRKYRTIIKSLVEIWTFLITAIWLWAKQQKSRVAMHYKMICDFYISPYM